MYGAILSLAAEIGAPFVRRMLADKIGAGNAQLAEEVIGAIAERVGVSPEVLDSYARENPEVARAAIQEVDRMGPELMELAIVEARAREAIMLAEIEKGGWKSSWRPAAMYIIGFLWVWNGVLLHLLNAIFKIALPPMPWEILLGGTGLYLSLYMGGHTVKSVMSQGAR